MIDKAHPDLVGHIADEIRDACLAVIGRVVTFNASRQIAERVAQKIASLPASPEPVPATNQAGEVPVEATEAMLRAYAPNCDHDDLLRSIWRTMHAAALSQTPPPPSLSTDVQSAATGCREHATGEVDYEQALRSFVVTSGAALASTDPKHVRFNAADMIAFAKTLATVAAGDDEGVAEQAFRAGHRAARIRYAPAEPNSPTRFEDVDWEDSAIRLLPQGGGK